MRSGSAATTQQMRARSRFSDGLLVSWLAPSKETAVEFSRHSNMLLCSDIRAATAFYTQHLGLTVSADLGWFVGLEHPAGRDRYEMSLCDAQHEFVPESLRAPAAGLMLAFEVEDADAALARLREAGVPIRTDIRDEPWGQRHFIAQAPDGVALDVFHLVPPDMEWMKQHGFA